eukprot:6314888-Pyramimonas_sp.AAC.1
MQVAVERHAAPAAPTLHGLGVAQHAPQRRGASDAEAARLEAPRLGGSPLAAAARCSAACGCSL